MGWIAEVAYSAVKKGKLINRGFLNGAWCPIYGTGATVVILCLSPIKEHIILLFLASFALTSLIEFITGFALEKMYKCRWWDYSDRRFNICGYICLEFSIIWGVVGVIFVIIINPVIVDFLSIIPLWLGAAVLSALVAAFLIDTAVSLAAARHLVMRIKELDRIAEDMRRISDELSETVYRNAVELKEKRQEYKAHLAALKETYRIKLDQKNNTRLIKAFPESKMKHLSYQEQLDKLKKIHLRPQKRP